MYRSIVALVFVSLVSVGCAAVPDVGEPGGSSVLSDDLRRPRICPAIAILCIEGYRPKQLPNCRQTCVPDRGTHECTSDDECQIYCITTPCPVGACVGHRCVAEDPSPCDTVRCAAGTHCEARGGRAECVPDRCAPPRTFNELTGQCECTTIAFCVTGWTWDPERCECISPCATVRCAAGTHCVADGGHVACVPDETSPCRTTGCSGQICASEDVITTCEYREEYACYETATCELQANGSCGWTSTPELTECLAAFGR